VASPDDDDVEMRAPRFLPIGDEAIEALIHGRPVDAPTPAHQSLVAFARLVRAEGEGPMLRTR
jgi:hypothetical protein